MEIEIVPAVYEIVKTHPNTLLFASISGAHLYGFPSQNSDWDIRGAHLLPLSDVLGMKESKDVYEFMEFVDEVEIDLVSYDLKKFCNLIRKKNGNVLEQLASPLTILNSSEGEQLRDIARRSLTKHHIGHYRGMAKNRFRSFQKDPVLKTGLYAIRALLTGINLLLSEEVEADLGRLISLNYVEKEERTLVEELIRLKAKDEKIHVEGALLLSLESLIEALFGKIEASYHKSALKDEVPEAMKELDRFLIATRLSQG